MEKSFGEKIGYGSFGQVYVNNDDPSTCVKVTNKDNDVNFCRKWTNEFEKIVSILTHLEPLKRYKKLEMVRIIKPVEFNETNTICFMKIPRIFRPKLEHETKCEYDKKQFITLQAQLGHKDVSMTHKGRGEFVGIKQIREYMGDDDLDVACFELGIMMGLIHYNGRNDGLDIEVFLGKEYRSKKCRFYIADFDMTSRIETYDALTIEKMYHSLDDIPYFPRKNVNRKMFDLFKNGYYSCVPFEIADKVFTEYEK